MDDGDGHDDDDSDGGHDDDDSVGGDGGHDGDDSDGGDAGDGCDGGDGDIDGDDANEYTSGECLQQKEVETRNDTFSLFIYGIQFFLLCFRIVFLILETDNSYKIISKNIKFCILY